jgi:hypothetical protein
VQVYRASVNRRPLDGIVGIGAQLPGDQEH